MRYLTFVAVLVLLVLCRPRTSSAAPVDDYPEGSYQQSCRDIRMRGDDLRARCADTRGRYHEAVLDGADRCWGDISNNDGQLVCNKNGRLPEGAYLQTCRDVHVRYNVMRARCQNRDGNWVETSLPYFFRCNGQIENIDGQLRCAGRGEPEHVGEHERDRDGDRGPAPRGSYLETCREVHQRGDSLRAVCQTMGGNWIETVLSDLDRCVGDIVNDDGHLACTRRGGRLVPRGSYVETCRNIYVRGDNLRAMCQDRDRRWVWTELHDWDDCRGGIRNEDGRLRCVRYPR